MVCYKRSCKINNILHGSHRKPCINYREVQRNFMIRPIDEKSSILTYLFDFSIQFFFNYFIKLNYVSVRVWCEEKEERRKRSGVNVIY